MASESSESSEPAPSVRSGPSGLDRRIVLRGVALVGVAGASVPLVAACGSGPGGNGSGGGPGPGNYGGGEDDGGNGDDAGNQDDGGNQAKPGEQLTTTAEVAVGGGVILKDKKVVVAQPTEGTFKAYSAICTHNKCVVSRIADNTITCDCHTSQFSTTDGSVVSPPADRPLPEVKITVDGDKITRA